MSSPTPSERASIQRAKIGLQQAERRLEMAKKQEADSQMDVAAPKSSDRQRSVHRAQVKGGSLAAGLDEEVPTVSKPTPNSKTPGGKEKERRLDIEGSDEERQGAEEVMKSKQFLSSKAVGGKGKERALDHSEEGGESKKSGEEEEEGSNGEKDGEDDDETDDEDETDGEDEDKVEDLDGEESVKSQGAPPAQKERGKASSTPKVIPAMGGSSKKIHPKGTTPFAGRCARCLAAGEECVPPRKGGKSCLRCKRIKKKCEPKETKATTQKGDKEDTAPPPKRGYKRRSTIAATSTAADFGVLRQPSPPESSPAESNNDVIVVKPLLRRTVAPPPLRPLKRKHVEEAEPNQPTTRTPSEFSGRSLVTQRQNTAFVEIPTSRPSGSRTPAHLLTGDLPPALETRLRNIEDMQITMNERLTSMVGAVERMEDLFLGWMASQNRDNYDGDYEYGGDYE